MLDRFGPGAQVLWSDDGIVVRLPEAVDRIPADELLFDPDAIEQAVVQAVPAVVVPTARRRRRAAARCRRPPVGRALPFRRRRAHPRRSPVRA